MELRGEHLVLIGVDIDAASALLPAFNGDERFNIWSGYASEITLIDVRSDMQETQALPGGTIWRISDQTDALIGVAETALLPPPDTAWIALLIIRREFQGKGYGKEAAMLLEKYLFSYPNIKQIGLAVLVLNAPAQAFWEKRGYVRGKRTNDTQGHDVYEYRLLRR